MSLQCTLLVRLLRPVSKAIIDNFTGMRAATYVQFLGVNPFYLLVRFEPHVLFLGTSACCHLLNFLFKWAVKHHFGSKAHSAPHNFLVIWVTGHVWGVRGSCILQTWNLVWVNRLCYGWMQLLLSRLAYYMNFAVEEAKLTLIFG